VPLSFTTLWFLDLNLSVGGRPCLFDKNKLRSPLN
jgi:hypothetical protein